MPYSSEDQGIKMLAFTVYSNDLKNTLMKNFYHENSEMIDEVEIETEHKMSGKYCGTLKVTMRYFLVHASVNNRFIICILYKE